MNRIIYALFISLTLFAFTPNTSEAQTNAPRQQSSQGQQAGAESVKVWVNTSSHVYHCPGTRWYGATKRGEYMTQKQAQKDGDRPAYGKTCS